MNAGTVCSTRIKFFPRHFRESELCFFSRLTFFRQSAPIRSVRQSAANPQRSGRPIRANPLPIRRQSAAEWRGVATRACWNSTNPQSRDSQNPVGARANPERSGRLDMQFCKPARKPKRRAAADAPNRGGYS